MKDRQRTVVLLCSLLLFLPVHQVAAGGGDHDPQVSEDKTPELLKIFPYKIMFVTGELS